MCVAQSSGDWEWRGTVYAWLPDLESSTQFPSGAGGPTINVDSDQLIDNLDMTFMGALHVNKEHWGIFTDLIYMDEGASQSRVREFTLGPGQRPAEVELDAHLDLKSWVWSLAGTYRLMDEASGSVDLLAGARMLDSDQELTWPFPGQLGDLELAGPSGSSELSGTNWDAIIGLMGVMWFGDDERWMVPWHVDLGTGDSDFTWQLMAGVGYRFDWGSVLLTYRHLDYELDPDGIASDLTLSGPMLGASFTW